MLSSMKRFLRGADARRRNERGVTLTGYGLLMSSLVVVSLGAIELMNTSSNTVLSNTGASVGNPRPSVSETKTDAVPTAPPWVGARGDGTCSAGFDGCPLGVTLAADPTLYQPPSMSGAVLWAGSAAGVDFSNLRDDAAASVSLESVVQLNGEWQPPLTDPDGNPTAVVAQPGDLVCTYLIHASPTVPNTFVFDVQFQGEILGTAYNSDFAPDPVFAAPGTSIPAGNYLEGGDDFDIAGNTLTVHGMANAAYEYDEIRVFVRC